MTAVINLTIAKGNSTAPPRLRVDWLNFDGVFFVFTILMLEIFTQRLHEA